MSGINVSAKELFDAFGEAQRKAERYDELLEELEAVQKHFLALSSSLASEAEGFKGDAELQFGWAGKAQGFKIAASKLRDILSDEGQGKA